MEDIDKTNQLNLLYDLYHELLTKKQQLYFSLYLMEDFSLQEIANKLNVSRSAVHYAITNIVNILQTYELKLRLLAKETQRKALYAKYEHTKVQDLKMLIAELKKVN